MLYLITTVRRHRGEGRTRTASKPHHISDGTEKGEAAFKWDCGLLGLCGESHKGKTCRAQSALNERCCWGGMEEQGRRARAERHTTHKGTQQKGTQLNAWRNGQVNRPSVCQTCTSFLPDTMGRQDGPVD